MQLDKRTFILITKHAPKEGRKAGKEEEWTIEQDMS